MKLTKSRLLPSDVSSERSLEKSSDRKAESLWSAVTTCIKKKEITNLYPNKGGRNLHTEKIETRTREIDCKNRRLSQEVFHKETYWNIVKEYNGVEWGKRWIIQHSK